MVNLVAVQPEVSLKDYQTALSFRQKIMNLAEQAVSGLPDYPTLLAFPEMIGLPLLLTLQNFEDKLGQSIKKVLTLSWKDILIRAWKHKYVGLSLMYLPSAIPAYEAYMTAFCEAAKTFKVTIVAGSSLLPFITHEPSLGLHIANPRVYNTAFVLGPKGNLLGQTHKVHLTQGLESRIGIFKGRLQDMQVIHTAVGKVGVAICLDGFHDSIIGHLDGLGAEIIVQPSANNALWTRPWPKDKSLTEGEAWFRYGIRETLKDTQNIRYGVNPMLNGDLWELHFEGVSSIIQVGAEMTVIAQAVSTTESLVKATVDVQNPTR